ncbi:MAG: hypothetical protein QM488_20245 [Rhizobiaceae bacterium]
MFLRETTDISDRLKKAGVEIHAPPLLKSAGGIFAYARDMDENLIEILRPPRQIRIINLGSRP